jgi:ubiquitin thioesterase protein OTUB1
LFFEYYLCEAAEGEFEVAANLLKETKDWLLSIGYSDLAFEDFYEITLDNFKRGISADEICELFCVDDISNSIVVYFRLITSAFLQRNADEFLPFIADSGMLIDAFCSSQVEAFGRESDQIHIIALSRALQVTVKVAYLDSSDTKLNFHEFEAGNLVLHLLYRPGHYDILYK